MKETRTMSDKKQRSLQRLSERYYGKTDLLKEWAGYEHIDPGYVADLARRVRGHSLDLAYRGDDNFTERSIPVTTSTTNQKEQTSCYMK